VAVTGDAVIAAIFLAPVVLFGVIAAAAAGGSGDWSIVGVMTAIGLAASALILGVTRLLMALIHREHPARFAAFAAALGGLPEPTVYSRLYAAAVSAPSGMSRRARKVKPAAR
jgi:hypothetical protein